MVLSGNEPADLGETLEHLVSKIESKYEPVLKEWDGDMEELRGMKDMLDGLLK